MCRVWLPSLNKAQEGFLFEPSPPALFVYQYSAYLYGSTGCAQADKRYKEMQVCKQEGARAVRFFAVCFLVNVGVWHHCWKFLWVFQRERERERLGRVRWGGRETDREDYRRLSCARLTPSASHALTCAGTFVKRNFCFLWGISSLSLPTPRWYGLTALLRGAAGFFAALFEVVPRTGRSGRPALRSGGD